MPAPSLSLADHVCLALVAERPTHGWAIVKLLAPDGELGQVWHLSRPLTYRSIDRLTAAGLIRRRLDGRRTELRAGRSGRTESERWLDEPVAHLRDIRIDFLLKLLLNERAGRAVDDLVVHQIEILTPAIRSLTSEPAQTPVELWRQESARAAERFLRQIRKGLVSSP